jgi:hypothetical protein
MLRNPPLGAIHNLRHSLPSYSLLPSPLSIFPFPFPLFLPKHSQTAHTYPINPLSLFVSHPAYPNCSPSILKLLTPPPLSSPLPPRTRKKSFHKTKLYVRLKKKDFFSKGLLFFIEQIVIVLYVKNAVICYKLVLNMLFAINFFTYLYQFDHKSQSTFGTVSNGMGDHQKLEVCQAAVRRCSRILRAWVYNEGGILHFERIRKFVARYVIPQI